MQYVTQNYKKKNKLIVMSNSKVLKLEQTDGDRTNKQRDLPEDR